MGETTTPQESFVESVTAGLIVIVLAIFLFGDLSQPMAMLAAGLILLGSGVYQRSRGWHVSILTWVLGVILALGGLGVQLFLIATMRISWIAVALLIVGGYLLLSRRR